MGEPRRAVAGLPEPDPADAVRPTARRAAELESLCQHRHQERRHRRVEPARRPLGLPAGLLRRGPGPAVTHDPGRLDSGLVRGSDGRLRRLTWAECAALQGFPAECGSSGTVASRFRQIGNAVQADVGEALGRVLLTALRAGTASTAPAPLRRPAEFGKRVRYTVAEHRTNGAHRVRVRAQVVAESVDAAR